jgi:SAM-dependent methyltransferase
MSQPELAEHRRYLSDEVRTAAYRAALAEVVRPDDVVLDLGCGTGALGYFACEAGASRVIALDRGDILELAARLAADNGYADRITHVRASSAEAELLTRADVIVCDQIGGLVHDAGILTYFADARERLLAADGRLLPASFRIFLAPVTFERGREAIDFWASKPSAIDVTAAHSMAANTEWHYSTDPDELVALAQGTEGKELARFESHHVDPITGMATFDVTTPGRFDGFIGWFEARLSASITLTNNPWAAGRFDRWCNFYGVDQPADVDTGDRLHLQLDIRPRLEIASWSTEILHADGRRQRHRQSTFHASFLSVPTLDRYALDAVVPDSGRIALVRAVLDLIDGSRTQADIVRMLADRVGDGFVSRAHLETFVRKVTTLSR